MRKVHIFGFVYELCHLKQHRELTKISISHIVKAMIIKNNALFKHHLKY